MTEGRVPRRRPAAEPVVDEGPRETFEPPVHLDGDAAAVWTEIVDQHHDPGRIVGPDLEAYCGQVAMLRDARRRVAREGTIIANERGRPEAHPAIALELRAQAEIRAWGDKFRGRSKSRGRA